MESIIEVEHLSKSFGEVKAVQDLSFSVGRGEFFAFLGVNGAGKSTTISILSGTLRRDAGEVRIAGKKWTEDPVAIKKSLGVVFQQSALDASLSTRENLACRAAFYGITGEKFEKRLEELKELLQFDFSLSRPLSKLSGGQRRRVDIARALLHRPQILILDEPTTGLDPKTRRTLWQVVSSLRKTEKLTVFLTTHYMEEAADADRVLILDSGRIAAEGTPLELKERYTGDYLLLYHITEEEVRALGDSYEAIPDGWRVAVSNTAAATDLILKNPGLFRDYELIKGKMDDVFLAVTGRKTGEEGGETA